MKCYFHSFDHFYVAQKYCHFHTHFNKLSCIFILGYLQCKLYMHVQSTDIGRFFLRSHLNNFPYMFCCCCCSIRFPPYRTRWIKIYIRVCFSVCVFLLFIFTKLSCGIQHILVYTTHTNFAREKNEFDKPICMPHNVKISQWQPTAVLLWYSQKRITAQNHIFTTI